jgi:hypothetical protein
MLADMSDTTKWFHKTNKDDDDDKYKILEVKNCCLEYGSVQ